MYKKSLNKKQIKILKEIKEEIEYINNTYSYLNNSLPKVKILNNNIEKKLKK